MSEKRRMANRRNAQSSTGPRTPKGKSRSSKNAVTHGLTARKIVLPGERPAEFDRFRHALIAELAPEGGFERELAEMIATLLWRLRRVPAVESHLYSWLGYVNERAYDGDQARMLSRAQAGVYQPMSFLVAPGESTPPMEMREPLEHGRTLQNLFAYPALNNLTRYEVALRRELMRTWTFLHEVQDARRKRGLDEKVSASAASADDVGISADSLVTGSTTETEFNPAEAARPTALVLVSGEVERHEPFPSDTTIASPAARPQLPIDRATFKLMKKALGEE